MNNNNSLAVIVTGIGGGGHGEQILKALRLGQHKYTIIGTDLSAYPTGRALVDHFQQVPRADDPNYLKTIFALVEQYQVKALFHGSEPEMLMFSKNKAAIEARGVYLPVNPPELLNICQNKANTMAFLNAQGFAIPQSYTICSETDLAQIREFPVVIKPSVGGGGSANVFIAQTSAELAAFSHYLLMLYPEFIAQNYVGTPEQEYTVGVLFGQEGELLNSIAIKRVIGTTLSTRLQVPNKTNRSELGKTLVISSGVSQGQIGNWPMVTKPCEQIAKALNPCAPINIQCRLVDGKVMPFEINPRFSGTTSLRAMAGYNEPDTLIRREVLGETITPFFDYQHPLIMRGLMEQTLLGVEIT